jgi:hypothetical protein
MLRSYDNDAAALRPDAELIVLYLKREIGRDKRNLGALNSTTFYSPVTSAPIWRSRSWR